MVFLQSLLSISRLLLLLRPSPDYSNGYSYECDYYDDYYSFFFCCCSAAADATRAATILLPILPLPLPLPLPPLLLILALPLGTMFYFKLIIDNSRRRTLACLKDSDAISSTAWRTSEVRTWRQLFEGSSPNPRWDLEI